LPSAGAEDAAPAEQVEAIFSKTSNGYKRTLLPDGSFRPETYRFAKGEFWGGEIADPSMDYLTIDDIARVVAPALAKQNYNAAPPADASDLLIVINWGTTAAPEHRTMDLAYELVEGAELGAGMDGHVDGLQERRLDGGGSTWDLGDSSPLDAAIVPDRSVRLSTLPAAQGSRLDLMVQESVQLQAQNDAWARTGQDSARMLGYLHFTDAELQRYRYFVVLLAYDRRTAAGKHPRLLWEARLSISEHRNQFDKRLPAMAWNASAYFGQDSHGLVHTPIPEGRVEIGELRSLEFTNASDAASVAPNGERVAYLRTKRGSNGIAVVGVDNPEGVLFAEIPARGSPVRVQWPDAQHVRVTLSSGESVAFDVGAKTWSQSAEGPGQGAWAAPDSVASELAAKFPHRKVTILGGDAARNRYLVAVARGSSPPRYYVYDTAADLVIDVGRSEGPL
jgi:hypothetical protein